MIDKLFQYYQIFRTFEADHQQRLVWEDNAKARIARDRAEANAKAQFDAMVAANPSGQLGTSLLNDVDALRRAGLFDQD